MSTPGNLVGPHMFRARRHRWRWRLWICDLCYAPWSMHPRNAIVYRRPGHDHTYYDKHAPHFEEGW